MNNEYVQLHTSGYRNQNRSPKFKAKLSTSASVACPLCAKNKTHSAARAAENTCVIIITLANKIFQAVSNSWKGTVLICCQTVYLHLGNACLPLSRSFCKLAGRRPGLRACNNSSPSYSLIGRANGVAQAIRGVNAATEAPCS